MLGISFCLAVIGGILYGIALVLAEIRTALTEIAKNTRSKSE